MLRADFYPRMKITLKGAAQETLIKLAEIGVGFLVGFLFKTATQDESVPPGMEWVIGSLVTLTLMVLDLMLRVARLGDDQQAGVAKLAGLVDQQTDGGLHKKALKYAGRELSPVDTQSVWAELMAMTQRSYRATNFIEPRSFYGSGQAKSVLLLQKTKMRLMPDFVLKKVLIWETAEEKNSPEARKIVEEHLSDKLAPMQLRGMLHQEIHRSSLLSRVLKDELGDQVDFAIFDEKVVLIWHLDGKRQISGSEVVETPERVEAFLKFFNCLFRECAEDGL